MQHIKDMNKRTFQQKKYPGKADRVVSEKWKGRHLKLQNACNPDSHRDIFDQSY